MERRKRYWCVEYYDYELGYNSWGDFKSVEEAENALRQLEEKHPHRKWSNSSNSGFIVNLRLLKKDQVQEFKI